MSAGPVESAGVPTPTSKRKGGDGRLTAAIDPHDQGPQDACGVFGVWAPGEDVAKLTYFGLYALQHRGQESAGIAVSNGRQILVYKDMGLVSQVFDESTLESLKGHVAIGHSRYSTTGASTWHNAQPTFHPTATGSIALAHNGNLINTPDLAAMVASRPGRRAARPPDADAASVHQRHRWSPSCSRHHPGQPVEERAAELLPADRGRLLASSGWTSTRCTPPATRRASARWSWVGWSAAGWSPARPPPSTSSVPRSSARSSPARWSPSTRTACAPSSSPSRRPRAASSSSSTSPAPTPSSPAAACTACRVEIGRRLRRGVPGRRRPGHPGARVRHPAAIGYAEESGIPYGKGLVKNSYVGRTFIQPSQTIRQLGIRLKLNPLRDVIEGKRLVVVDDSIVRGNTQRALVRMLREAGAREVHVRISSPPVKWPCFYGIDFATRAELIANGLTSDEICRSIDADSLGYIGLDDLVEATTVPRTTCAAPASTGTTRSRCPSPSCLGKHLLEAAAAKVALPVAQQPLTTRRTHPQERRDRQRRDPP